MELRLFSTSRWNFVLKDQVYKKKDLIGLPKIYLKKLTLPPLKQAGFLGYLATAIVYLPS